MEDISQLFNRNNFKKFADSRSDIIKPNCFTNHSEVVQNYYYKDIKHKYSFRDISNSELEDYELLGSLRDKRIKTLNYIEFNNIEGEYWNPDSKIATNFYPYHNCDVYECKRCKRLFLVYIEYSGHFPQQRIRNVKNNLIAEEPSNCSIEIPDEKIPRLMKILNLNDDNFQKSIDENKRLARVKTDFKIDDIIISKTSYQNYIVVAKSEIIYKITTEFT